MTYTNATKEEKVFNENLDKWLKIIKVARYNYLKQHVLKILDEFKNKKKVLELGCGFTPYLNCFDKRYTYGLDMSKNLLDLNDKSVANFIHGDILNCSKYFKQKKFDLVFMVGVLHHINEKDHKLVLYEIKKLLKNNGYLLIVEPNMISITGVYYLIKKLIQKMFGEIFVTKLIGFFSKNEKYIYPWKLKKLLRNNEFLITKNYSIQLLRLPPIGYLKKINIESLNRAFDPFLRKSSLLGTTLVLMSKRI